MDLADHRLVPTLRNLHVIKWAGTLVDFMTYIFPGAGTRRAASPIRKAGRRKNAILKAIYFILKVMNFILKRMVSVRKQVHQPTQVRVDKLRGPQ